MARYAHITGWGMCVPQRVLTNDDLSKMVDTSDDWIRTRTGIHERHVASPKESTASLAAAAAINALAVAGLPPRQVQLIIVATCTPEHNFPSTACVVQDQIGAGYGPAFDLSAACSGFVYALTVASQMVSSGAVNNALVIGAETMSRLLDWNDRATCVLFGDGAGAVVLQADERPGGVLSTSLHADGSGGELLIVPAGGSSLPTTVETLEKGDNFIKMNGNEVYRFATRVLAKSAREVVEHAGLTMNDIKLFIPHQANSRIIQSAAKELQIPMDRFVVNVDRYGNTSAATIPIALCESLEAGRISPGDHLVFTAFGAGLTWGSAVVKWMAAPARKQLRTMWIDRLLARARSFARRTRRRIESIITIKNDD